MDKVKIQEVAAEAGVSSSEVLEKANELGFNVKAASSSISAENAEILFNYIVSGKLPSGFEKPQKKLPKQKESLQTAKLQEVSTEDKPKDLLTKKESKKTLKESIKTTTKSNITTKKKDSDILAGMTIVKQKNTSASAPKQKLEAPKESTAKKKKVNKKPAVQKDNGSKVEISDRNFMDTGFELYEEQEIVLPDFSDKNIYEEFKRQEQRIKEDQYKRPTIFSKALSLSQGNLSRGGKKRKKYIKAEESVEKVTSIEIPENVRVYEFAEKIGKSVGEVVKVLFSLGTMVTKNDFLDKDSIEILSDEFDVKVTIINPLDALDYVAVYDSQKDINPIERPPVITIMGHVDHGKTSLLDKIRSTKVAAREAGGITQHVGAYQVEKNGKKITFIDTPGHEAFTEMRSRGAQATDIAIIVVAADDGVMPQTKEAINHAKAAGVPIIVAITKMDKENANPDMVKAGLAELGITPVDWGGEYEFVPVSSHTGLGIEDLLDVILLQAEIMELKADPKRNAKAIVIESSIEKGFGPVANIIVKNGTLRVGDNVIVGKTYGRIKAIKLDNGVNAKEIGPSTPAAIVGLNEVPSAGEIMIAMGSEKEVRELAEKISEYDRAKQLSRSTKASLDDLSALIAEGKLKVLSVIVKTDVQGSLDAIKSSLEKLRNEEVKVNIVHDGVGSITESDVALAAAGEKKVILGFNVKPNSSVKQKAKELGVDIRTYSIIYSLLDDVRAMLSGMMSPIISEEIVGSAEVRETFYVAKIGTIAGCKVDNGTIIRGGMAKVIRDGKELYTGKIASLKRFSEDVREVKSGYECGIVIDGFNDIKVGDKIEVFKNVEEQASL